MKKFVPLLSGVIVLLALSGCPTPDNPILDGTVPKSSTKEITAFSFTAASNAALNEDETGTITGTDIAVTVPYKTDVTALTATFTITGTGVSVGGTPQTSSTTPNNFTSPVVYTVMAEDGSTKDYTATVTITAAAAESSGFGSASNPGDSGILTLAESSETLTMIYVQNQESVVFPTKINDSGTQTLTTKFWMGETEVTNSVVAAVYQWAYDNGEFNSNVNDPNGLDTTTAKHGGQELINLDNGSTADCHIKYNDGSFTVDSGYGNHPVTDISWYGAVMFCNWLTEMRDGNTSNVVYTNIDSTWVDTETSEDVTKNGYRLPSSDEWEYAARYRGTDKTNYVSGYSNPYYTKGNSASGAAASYYYASYCQAVAYYKASEPTPTDDAVVKSLGAGSANTLGLYDMCGNVCEWCFTYIENGYGTFRVDKGGGWCNDADALQVGDSKNREPYDEISYLGFRLCRTEN